MVAYLLLALTLLTASPASAQTEALAETQHPLAAKFAVEIPPEARLAYSGPGAEEFPDGFPLAVGFGLAEAPGGDANLFLTATGRGPNAEGPRFLDKKDRLSQPGRFFPAPDFNPCLALVAIDASGAKLVKTINLRYQHDYKVTGRPIPLGQIGTTGEIPLASDLAQHSPDPNGISLAAAAPTPDGKRTWIADDYGPFLLQVDTGSGAILSRLGPGDGLPEVLTLRQDNKGFSGVAVTPSGKVVACMRAVLSPGGASKESKAAFIRLIVLDPATSATRMVAYPIDQAFYRRSFDAQLTGILTLDENRFLLVEQGRDKSGRDRNAVYLADLSQASDLSGLRTRDGAPLEMAKTTDLHELGVTFVKRTEIADLRKLGVTGQVSGLALLADRRTLLASQSGDYGLTSVVQNPSQTEDGLAYKTPGSYTFDSKRRVWMGGAQVSVGFALKNTKASPQVWRILLPAPVIK